jgi:lactate dehydrogenase-like 2-hydroxyacid dehydrogenase
VKSSHNGSLSFCLPLQSYDVSTAPKPVLVVTRPPTLPPEVAERVNRDFVVRLAETPESLTSDGLVERSDGASGFLVTPFDRIDASFFEGVASSVKIVATRSVGYDHVDVAAAARRHIAVANTPGVLTDAVADATILLLLGASRRAYEAQQFIRAGEWAHAAPIALIGRHLTGKVLGIFGMGRIGQAVAHRARALGMQIHYTNPSPLSEEDAHGAVFHQDPLELLGVSEFLSLHAPATPDTHHFLNAENLALLPRGAIVVNTARGELIRDEDLLAALDAGAVAAVGLDVFEHEPKIDPRYFNLKNAFLMPHLAAETIETQTAVGMLALDNIDAVLAGRPAPSLVIA